MLRVSFRPIGPWLWTYPWDLPELVVVPAGVPVPETGAKNSGSSALMGVPVVIAEKTTDMA
ncbi:MAG: hypothetical protein JWN03_6458 [Nocardia sp.]|uniref:hypothetical protein n=1 Tax=Nocardia sp. TaxID=1821 RepID=UPI002631C515|nr:hypothetical protein [Nocardia sp.]MCU1646183.1 hypothetical protein [Nocardia sp.]